MSFGPYAAAVIADGASHYWRLGETSGTSAADSVGSAPGTISGGVTLNQPGALSDGDPAMTFNGATGRVLTTALAMVPPVTLEAWIKTSGNNEPIWGIPYAGGNEQWTLDVSPTGVLFGNLINAAETLASVITGVRVINDGAWHHAVLRVQSAVLDLYIDGVFDKTAATTFPVAGLTRPFDIGHFDNPVQWWSGSLDEVAIYPLTLTPAQIANHYALRLATIAPPARHQPDLQTDFSAFLTELYKGMTVKAGTGSPETVVAAPVGAMYLRLDGGATSTLYIKQAGIGATGWAAK